MWVCRSYENGKADLKRACIYIFTESVVLCVVLHKSIIKNQWSFKLVFYTLENQKTTEDFLNVFIEV